MSSHAIAANNDSPNHYIEVDIESLVTKSTLECDSVYRQNIAGIAFAFATFDVFGVSFAWLFATYAHFHCFSTSISILIYGMSGRFFLISPRSCCLVNVLLAILIYLASSSVGTPRKSGR